MNAHRSQLFSLVVGLVEERMARRGLEPRSVDERTNLIEEGIIDSLEFLDLLAALEERAGVELDLLDSDPAMFTTIGGLVAELTHACSQLRGVGLVEGAVTK